MLQTILNLTKRLYPTGRAFRLAPGSTVSKLHEGLAVSELEAVDKAKSILNQILPDNDEFTEADAAAWEVKLQLLNGTGLALEDRKANILRHMRHPGGVFGRQASVYLEGELLAAGFNADLKVYENKFGGVIDPVTYDGGDTYHADSTTSGDQTRHGNAAAGATQATGTVISQLDQALEKNIAQTDINYRSTFIIAGSNYPDAVDIDAAREREFRNLILKLKPLQTHCFLFVNYV